MAMEWPAPLRHQLPEGVKDRLPREAARLRQLSGTLMEVFRRWGYHEVITPAFEFLETILAGQGSLGRREDYYQLFDRRGRTLALRPDMTAPIARLAATKLSGEPLPLRLSYWGAVFRHREHKSGALHEIWQAGVECIGAAGAPADAELIALACEALAATGLEGFKIGVGHVAFVEGVLAEAGVAPAQAASLKEALADRDLVAFEKAALLAPTPAGARLLLDLASFTGGYEEAVARFGALRNPQVARALAEIGETLRLLEAYGVAAQVALDLGLARLFGYYTGVVFEGYAPGVGAPVLGGGRYDNLLADFAGPGASPAPATGFAMDADRVLQALERQGKPAQPGGIDVLVVPAAGAMAAALATARALRAGGQAVEVAPEGLDAPAAAAYARARGARRTLPVTAAEAPATAPPGSGAPAAAGPGGQGPARRPVARMRGRDQTTPIH